jgi:L-fucose mutarotase/ribose pyranase (RbsD/FucU family)
MLCEYLSSFLSEAIVIQHIVTIKAMSQDGKSTKEIVDAVKSVYRVDYFDSLEVVDMEVVDML